MKNIIPVLIDFDFNKCIGEMVLKTDDLPFLPDNLVFSAGYRIIDSELLEDGTTVVKDAELVCVSALSDEQYTTYLKSVGKIK